MLFAEIYVFYFPPFADYKIMIGWPVIGSGIWVFIWVFGYWSIWPGITSKSNLSSAEKDGGIRCVDLSHMWKEQTLKVTGGRSAVPNPSFVHPRYRQVHCSLDGVTRVI